MTYDNYCLKTRKKITRRPLRACETCNNRIMADCPGYEAKQIKGISEDMRRFFSRCKGGEVQSSEVIK